MKLFPTIYHYNDLELNQHNMEIILKETESPKYEPQIKFYHSKYSLKESQIATKTPKF